MHGDRLELSYDMIVVDDSESLMIHFDEGTMKKEIEIWLFNEIMKHSRRIVLMDGNISQQSLNLDSKYANMIYVRNNSNEASKTTTIIIDAA